MKNIGKALLVLVLAMATACNGTTSPEAETEQPEVVAEDTLQPLETAPDTTLQIVQEITIRAVGKDPQKMVFDQDTLEVKANALVRVNLINEGTDPTMVHNIVFTTPGRYRQVALEGAKVGPSGNYVPDNPTVLAASPLALPGQTVQIEFKAPEKPGSYEFVCTYPDHYERMTGKLLVR